MTPKNKFHTQNRILSFYFPKYTTLSTFNLSYSFFSESDHSFRIGYFKSNKYSCPRMIVSRVLSHLKIVESFQTFNPNLRVLITLQSTIPRGCTCSWMIVSYPPKIYQSSTTLWPTIWTGCCLMNDHPNLRVQSALQPRIIVSRLVLYSLKNCRIFPNF